MNVAERIRSGALPSSHEGADWRLYRGTATYAPTLEGFARALWDIAYVRMQAFARDAETEAAAEDWP